ncbi:MAG: branched-chain amino acid ABC transporter permease [Rhizobiaceae bacterium]
MPGWASLIGADYPDFLQKFAIFGIFAIGFNILFGLTGYLSFGHAVFIGVGSYVSVWSFKLLTMNVLPAIAFSIIVAGVFAYIIGYVSLRRSGIYFSILTLAFAQMCYSLAYSVLGFITNGETGLQVRALRKTAEQPLLDADIRIIDQAMGVVEHGVPITNFFGVRMGGYSGYYFCAILLIICFFIAQRITNSNFGMMLKAIKSNQNRLNYTGIHTRPYLLTAFVISGMYAGLAGSLMAVTDPLAGAERMQWTASGEVVLMTILGGVGTLVGPVLGAGLIKFAEQKVSSWNEGILHNFWSFLPESLQDGFVWVSSLFVGEGWHLTLGLIFMGIVIFLPGGLMEGFWRLAAFFSRKPKPNSPGASASQAAE